jgi:hypothetical protein
MATGERVKAGVIEAVPCVHVPPGRVADFETSRFSDKPIAVPATESGDARVTVALPLAPGYVMAPTPLTDEYRQAVDALEYTTVAES